MSDKCECFEKYPDKKYFEFPSVVYHGGYDAYACLEHNIWLEGQCSDPECEFCSGDRKTPLECFTVSICGKCKNKFISDFISEDDFVCDDCFV